MTESRVVPGGTPKWVRDATANDSDKSFTVPAGKTWNMMMVRFDLTNTATVGDRRPSLVITPAGGGSFTIFTGVALAASATGRYVCSFTGVSDDYATTSYLVAMNFAPMILPAGSVVRVYDLSTIDPAADDLTVDLHYVEYDA